MSIVPSLFPAVVLCVATIAAYTAPDLEAQTKVLRGRVVGLDGAPAPEARIRIVGAGEPVLFDSGEFELEIPAGDETVDVVSLVDELEVVYPPDGRVPVPVGDVHVVIIMDEPVVRTVTKALAERSRRLQNVLEDNSQTLGSLESQVQELARLVGIREEDLRSELVLRERQAEHFPRIAATVRDFMLQARDLQSALAIVGASTDNAQILRITIEEALVPYNDAFTELNNGSDGFIEVIEEYWDDGAVRSGEFRSFWNNTAKRIHDLQILPLNTQLATIQSEVIEGNANSRRAQEARTQLLARVAELDSWLDQLEDEGNGVLQRLGPS